MSPPKKDDGRLHLRVPPKLKAWARDYAMRNQTNLTALVINHLQRLRREELEQVRASYEATQV